MAVQLRMIEKVRREGERGTAKERERKSDCFSRKIHMMSKKMLFHILRERQKMPRARFRWFQFITVSIKTYYAGEFQITFFCQSTKAYTEHTITHGHVYDKKNAIAKNWQPSIFPINPWTPNVHFLLYPFGTRAFVACVCAWNCRDRSAIRFVDIILKTELLQNTRKANNNNNDYDDEQVR